MNVPLKTLLSGQGLRLIDLAKALGIDKATATRWAQKSVPAERVRDVERVTGIPRQNLRPDLFAVGSDGDVA